MNSQSEVLLYLVENFIQRFTIGTLTEYFIINFAFTDIDFVFCFATHEET